MPPRPALKLKQNRPLSAIYLGTSGDNTALSSSLGSTSTPPSLPDLPEPPSPGASISSSGSGLPSPPATNSTGSGSTGDPASIAFRQRHFSLNSIGSNSGGTNVFDLNESGSPPTMHHASRPGSAQNTLRRSSGSRSSSRLGRQGEDDDADDDEGLDDTNDVDGNDNDEDTARLDKRQGLTKSSKENISALQRVKSLTQRNKMVLDKLTSIRLNSPSPVNSHTRTSTPLLARTSAPSNSSSSSSSQVSSARLSQPQARHALRAPPIDRQLSGSETEREGSVHSTSRFTHTSSSSSSHLRSFNTSHSNPRLTAGDEGVDGRITPPSAPLNQFHTRVRLTSAPASPQKARLVSASASASKQSANSESPSRRRKRTSMASVSSLMEYDEHESIGSNTDRDKDMDTFGRGDKTREITQSALAAVASSRRSPLGTRKTRGQLPREFRDAGAENTIGRRGSLDAARTNGRYSAEPATPHRNGHRSTGSMQYSPVKQGNAAPGSGPGRSSTVRGELPNRWGSDDLTHTSTPSVSNQPEREVEGRGQDRRERKQSLRPGSAESALTLNAGRSLVKEGFRAAGLRKRDGQGGDVFQGGEEKDSERRVEWSPYPESVDSTLGDRDAVLVRSTQREMDGRTRAGQSTARAATSMTDYRPIDRDGGDEDGALRTAPILRGYRSAYPLAGPETLRDRPLSRDPSLTRRDSDKEPGSDRAGSTLGRYNTAHAHIGASLERYPSPFGTRRGTTPLPASSTSTASGASNGTATPSIPLQPPAEHTRLMLESLSLFEGQLSRFSGGGSPTASSAELLRNAQSLTFAAERLNALLRAGTARALEEQIDAEVNSVDGIGGTKEVIEAWRKFGGDYREGLRYSDDMVRGITGLLLGVGRVLRENGAGGDAASHSRNTSLEDENRSRTGASPDVGGRESRRSDREDAFRRLSARPDSSLGNRPPSAFNTLRERELQRLDTPPPNSATSRTAPRESVRRLLTPREQREQEQQRLADESAELGASDSQRTIGRDYEPSPTPANRHSLASLSSGDRAQTLPPLQIPKPVPTRAPVSTVRRATTSDEKVSTLRGVTDRRKPSVTSIATVRATPPSLSTFSTLGPTTALSTHTVSNGVQDTPSPLMRTDSGRSARSGVTFSRPSTVSVSTLSGLQQQDNRKRSAESGNASGTESTGKPGTPSVVARSRLGTSSPMTPVSGSDAERDSRRKTVGSRMMRASLDGSQLDRLDMKANTETVNAADRSAASSILPGLAAGRRERRRTVTDIWPNGNE